MTKKASPRKPAKPKKAAATGEFPVELVRALARKGLWKQSHIARILRVSYGTVLTTQQEAELREAVEDGKALWAADTLEQFKEMTIRGKFDPAILYATKQEPIGWSDRAVLSGPDGGPIPVEIHGAADRLVDMIARLQAAAAGPKA